MKKSFVIKVMYWTGNYCLNTKGEEAKEMVKVENVIITPSNDTLVKLKNSNDYINYNNMKGRLYAGPYEVDPANSAFFNEFNVMLPLIKYVD